ncbi:hypothetical protein NE237_026365 [Protea cynaroides]|uniref:Uncharacterized protein n=1 Tax=Protea cynaroides TaxID=273540 RepID=A0A9Q0K0E7_9MAGN|nr:hypothetical protein NE237_026365 [Protea cynaroides]
MRLENLKLNRVLGRAAKLGILRSFLDLVIDRMVMRKLKKSFQRNPSSSAQQLKVGMQNSIGNGRRGFESHLETGMDFHVFSCVQIPKAVEWQHVNLSFTCIEIRVKDSYLPYLCQLKHLQELYLSVNNFEGILLPCLQNLTTLRLDLSHNRFKGNIHSSLISSLTSLVSISLSYNDFDGLFSFISFANNSNLESIDLSSAGYKLKVETEYPSWVPPFQLKVLLLSNNNLNATIPRFLTTQHNLTFIDLSSNNLTGMFPTWLLENNKMLEVLILRNNSLSGHFVSPSNIHKAAYFVDISNNGFNGLLQKNIGKMLPNLKTPEMKNQFSTFSNTSYEGNPFLCGPPLSRLCSSNKESATTSIGVNGNDDLDMTTFFASFVASYVVFLLGFGAVLYINPYWQRMWFRFIEHCIYSCHEFVLDTWYKLIFRACN